MSKMKRSSESIAEMSLTVLFLMSLTAVGASNPDGEMALANVTRLATGDFFTLLGTDCGPTRCMEASHGTALAAMGAGGCVCQCRGDTAFREDQRICVNHIDECRMASFGRGATKPQIPFVFLPLKGQIIHPSQEIVFTDVIDAVCAVTSAQYLTSSGWVTLRDVVDNDVPFGLYRDEGSTFLQWRGSAALHTRLEGRLVTAHVFCSAPAPAMVAASCAAFRVAGASQNALLDVRSIPFHAGETVTTEPITQSHGLSVLESLAIGVCVLVLVFIYAAGIIIYVHYKQKQKRKEKDPELNLSNTLSTDNESTLDSRIGMDNMRMKTNPLLKMEGMGNDFIHDAGLSDVSEHTEDTMDSSPNNTQRFQKTNSNVVSAMVHTRRKKPVRPSVRATSTPERVLERLQRRSASPDMERAPHSDLSIVDCSLERIERHTDQQSSPQSNGEPTIRRKLYFNPVFFESEHLKNPPPAAVEFLTKIREVMSIAKEKMTSKRFIPILTDIPEEELYHTIDLGWDIPCARRGRRFSAISLKRENSRRAVHCGGCPGCDSSELSQKATALMRSNSCKTCVSDDYKQKIVRRWLDEVPSPNSITRPVKSIAKVSGTPRVIEPKLNDRVIVNLTERVRREERQSFAINNLVNDESNNNFVKETKAIKKDDEISNFGFKNRNKDESLATQTTTLVKLEKKSPPSSHATRRIRKKLPPPPPPPISPPKSPKSEEVEAILPEVKKKMEAVIQELNKCRRVDPKEVDDFKLETTEPITPKIVIPIVAADSHYYSDDNLLSDSRKLNLYQNRENLVPLENIELNNISKRRRFSLDCGPEVHQKFEVDNQPNLQAARERLSRSWRDVKKAVEGYPLASQSIDYECENQSLPVSEIFINVIEPMYNNVPKPGPLTIEVRGSPVENRRNCTEDFDPDTLDRKPKREAKKRVEKILLKSGGSFKHKVVSTEIEENNNSSEVIFTRKIGSLRQIYEAKTKVHDDDVHVPFYERRGSLPYLNSELSTFARSSKTPDLIRQTEKDLKQPMPPKLRRSMDLSPKFSNATRESPPGERLRSPEERDRLPYLRSENLNARRSGRKSARTRSRRTDLKRLMKTEDSGYLSTDSNESKRRARYLMQLRPKYTPPGLMESQANLVKSLVQIESDTDELESLCDGRSESGGESVETDSVFFGNFDESKKIFAELGLSTFEMKLDPEQIDSGFMGETNIALSGDSDSEHRSVISIVAGRDGRASSASIAQLDDPPYKHSVEC